MAVDMFLKIDGIKGETQDKVHAESIDVLSWSWGLTQSGTMHGGSGGGSGKVNVQDISITKYMDSSTSALIKACAKGNHIPTVTLTVRKAGGKDALEYIKLTLKAVIITSVKTGASGLEDRLTETITLNFAEFAFEYVPQDDKGGKKASCTSAYNIAGNCEP